MWLVYGFGKRWKPVQTVTSAERFFACTTEFKWRAVVMLRGENHRLDMRSSRHICPLPNPIVLSGRDLNVRHTCEVFRALGLNIDGSSSPRPHSQPCGTQTCSSSGSGIGSHVSHLECAHTEMDEKLHLSALPRQLTLRGYLLICLRHSRIPPSSATAQCAPVFSHQTPSAAAPLHISSHQHIDPLRPRMLPPKLTQAVAFCAAEVLLRCCCRR